MLLCFIFTFPQASKRQPNLTKTKLRSKYKFEYVGVGEGAGVGALYGPPAIERLTDTSHWSLVYKPFRCYSIVSVIR